MAGWKKDYNLVRANPKTAAGFGNEDKDCTVRAMCFATNSSYADCHAFLGSVGRRDGHGMNTSVLTKTMNQPTVMNKKPTKLAYISQPRLGGHSMTIAKFLEHHPTGNYFCLKNGHAFAVVSGAVMDSFRMPAGARIFAAWKIG